MRIPKIQEKAITTDVLVVGGGGAGLRAAIEAKKEDVDVVLVSESRAGYANSTATSVGLVTYLRKEQKEKFFSRVVEEGGYLSNQRLVKVFIDDVVSRIPELRDLGVDLEVRHIKLEFPQIDEDQCIPRGHGEMRGLGLTKPLRDKAQNIGVKILDRTTVTRLLTSEKKVVGATAIDLEKGDFLTVLAKSIILGTGGAASIYLRSNNPRGIAGDGFVLAYQAGAELVDMEFVIFCVPIPQTEKKLGPDSFKERMKQATTELKRKDERWDFFTDFPPEAHYFLGGVKIDEECKTSLDNLYAAGEVTGGLFGASRLGGSALADIIVFGARAGSSAAQNAKNKKQIDLNFNEVKKEKERLQDMLQERENEISPHFLQHEIKSIMWNYAAIARTEKALNRGLGELEKLREQVSLLQAQNLKQLKEAVKAINMLDLAQIVIRAALERTESRGAHWRLDYPNPDNTNWLKNVIIHKVAGKMRLTSNPVIMTQLRSPDIPRRIGTGWSGYISI